MQAGIILVFVEVTMTNFVHRLDFLAGDSDLDVLAGDSAHQEISFGLEKYQYINQIIVKLY